MELILSVAVIAALLMWVGLLLVPWHPWATFENWNPLPAAPLADKLDDLTVLIPARNEAELLEDTLKQLLEQGEGLKIVVIDDRSDDDTCEIAKRFEDDRLSVIKGEETPEGWGGKLWALEQGLRIAETPLLLLLDADIGLKPAVIAGLRDKMLIEDLDLVSLMAVPPNRLFWERILMPAFVYFFKLIYPFALVNNALNNTAAAAGGCLMIRRDALERSGGFEAIRDTLIDDCNLARIVKRSGGRIWIGLTHSVFMKRPYVGLSDIWNMVARTAYFQLRYSPLLLLLCTGLMCVGFWTPVCAMIWGDRMDVILGAVGGMAMVVAYVPVVQYYRRSPMVALLLPFVATLFLMMTWSSAIRHYRGERWRWRGRTLYVKP